MLNGLTDFLDRRWRLLLLLTWLAYGAWLIYARWNYIAGFVLTDTDDNMRISQVRALLAGQDWFDLRQYKMNWPEGANMHWSRLVDLPLAGLILLGRLFLNGPQAEQMAVALALLIPLALLLVSLSLTVRRLVAPAAWPLAIACLFFAGSTMGMFQPTRIDHHNWQLALLALAIAGIADPKRARGGATLGIATAFRRHRARNADLSGGRRRRHGPVLDPRRRPAAAAGDLCGHACRRHRHAFLVFASTTTGCRSATPCRRSGCRTPCWPEHCC